MQSEIVKCINNPKNPYKKILFLGYDKEKTQIINSLILKNCYIDFSNKKISSLKSYDLIICFGYKFILDKELINNIQCPILNLHISYLPYNRGAHPNFWSFFENTPSGITIHLIDEGLDTGPIIYQKKINFDKGEKTFADTYLRLIREIENMFIYNLDNILKGKWLAKPQLGTGTYHKLVDLPSEFSGWNSEVKKEINRLKKITKLHAK